MANKPLVFFFVIAFATAWLIMGIAIAQNYGLFNIEFPLEPLLKLGSWIPNIAAFLFFINYFHFISFA